MPFDPRYRNGEDNKIPKRIKHSAIQVSSHQLNGGCVGAKCLASLMTKKRLSTHSPSVHVMLHMYTWWRTTSKRKDRKWRDICKARHAKEKKRASQQGFLFFQLTDQPTKRTCTSSVFFSSHSLTLAHACLHSHIASFKHIKERERDRERALVFFVIHSPENRNRKRGFRFFTCSLSRQLFLSQGFLSLEFAFFWH